MSKAAGRASPHKGRPGRNPAAILKSENGDVNYFSTVVFIFIAVLLLAFILDLFSIISTKQELDHCADQMVKQLQLSGGINGETDQLLGTGGLTIMNSLPSGAVIFMLSVSLSVISILLFWLLAAEGVFVIFQTQNPIMAIAKTVQAHDSIILDNFPMIHILHSIAIILIRFSGLPLPVCRLTSPTLHLHRMQLCGNAWQE